MPNAKDAKIPEIRRILTLGNTGNGKTSQFCTLPGRKFAYLFDPNALATLRGQDIDYEEIATAPATFDVKSLSKDNKSPSVMAAPNHTIYVDWEKDVEKKLASGFFNSYDWLALDSATTLLNLQMDRILTINGRAGQFPLQDDWGPQMVAFSNVISTFIGRRINLYITGHLKTDKDELTQRIVQLPLMTGQLREKIPLLFTDVFVMQAIEDGRGNVKYTMRTVPNQRETPIRTAFRGLHPIEDVTIDWKKQVEGQGLGGILLKEREGVAQH